LLFSWPVARDVCAPVTHQAPTHQRGDILRFRHPQRNRHLAVGLEAVMLAAYPKLLILDELGYLPRHQQQGLHRLRRGLQRPRTGDGDPRPPAAPQPCGHDPRRQLPPAGEAPLRAAPEAGGRGCRDRLDVIAGASPRGPSRLNGSADLCSCSPRRRPPARAPDARSCCRLAGDAA
jgi:hypothetical protein